MLIRKLVIVFGILIKRVKLSTDDNDINVNNNRIVTPRKSRTLGHIAGKVLGLIIYFIDDRSLSIHKCFLSTRA